MTTRPNGGIPKRVWIGVRDTRIAKANFFSTSESRIDGWGGWS